MPSEVPTLILEEADAKECNNDVPHHLTIGDFYADQDEKLEPSTILNQSKHSPSTLPCSSKSNAPEPQFPTPPSSVSSMWNPLDILESDWNTTSFRHRSTALHSSVKRPFTIARGNSQNLPEREKRCDMFKPRRTLSDKPFNTATSKVVAEGMTSDVIPKFNHNVTLGGQSDSSEEVESKGPDSTQERTRIYGSSVKIGKNDRLSMITPNGRGWVGFGSNNAVVTLTGDAGAVTCNDVKCATVHADRTMAADIGSSSTNLVITGRRGPSQSRKIDRCISDLNFDLPINKRKL